MRKNFLSFALGVTLLPASTLAAGFTFQNIIDQAKVLASKPYEAPAPIPKFMQELNFNEYQNIRFNPNKSLWRESKSQFQVMLVSPGLFYTHPVAVNVIDGQDVHPVAYNKNYFIFTDPDLEKRVPPDLGFAGFKLTYPLTKPDVQNQFLVFAGASYFRGVGKGNAWGASARGIAVNTGLPSGEEFPSFISYWLVRSSPDDPTMVFYGLLDGKSLSGAYKFTVTPGNTTELKVSAVLFLRQSIDLLGIAPLTSMFFYGENTGRPIGGWRRQVHDSDGLLIHNGPSDEWLWRPLINPQTLQMDYFQTEDVRGFGLMQRDTQLSDYEDLGAHYEQRPSTWVKPNSNWGKGHVVLVQLPSANETNDNMVAFWTPAKKVSKTTPIHLDYTISFGNSDIANEPVGKAINTFVGDGNQFGGGNVAGAYRVIIDFKGGPLDQLLPSAAVVGSVTAQEGSEVIEQFVEYNKPLHAWRLSILAKPKKDKPLALRAYLSEGDKTLTETWTYLLPPNNDIIPGS
jgi:glucans biosynthesis protein